MNKIKFLTVALLSLIVLNGCKKDDDKPKTPAVVKGKLVISTDGLKNLGSNYIYEGWLIVDGSPISAGSFNPSATSNTTFTASFEVDKSNLEKATAYIITIEPSPDNNPAASNVHILAGDFVANAALLTVSHKSALNNNFSSATGKYILATPTNGTSNNEKSGVWWLDPNGGSPVAGLSLPTLPSGWKYEGWAVINKIPVSTGTFTSVSGADESALFSGPTTGPAFPGEDFLMKAPTNLTFPTNLEDATIVISIEPVPDNSTAPFFLKPLLGVVPSSAEDHKVYNMTNNSISSNPNGTVVKNY